MDLDSAFQRKADDRSEQVIAGLLPEVQPYARAPIKKAAAAGVIVKVISGLRTYEEQDALYAEGRTTSGYKVTSARGGYSTHNFGIAFDIRIWASSGYQEGSPLYIAVGELGGNLGLEWGGKSKSANHLPRFGHFELRPDWALDMSENGMLIELQARKQAGKAVFD
jgi:peptidoglycan L-alanyl-D-glutamate endopeptidase CwlK